MSRGVRLQPGFTLIELMISLALAALLVAPLSTLVVNALTAQGVAGAINDVSQDARFAMRRIEAAVRATAPGVLAAKGATTTGSWLSPVAFCLRSNKNLVETTPADTGCNSSTTRTIAANVTAFNVQQFNAGAGAVQVIEISMTVTGAGGQAIALTSRTRLGGGTL